MARDLQNKCPHSTNEKGRPGCGQRMLFTGPDAVCDYRTKRSDFPPFVGLGSLSPEATGDLSYLWRPAQHAPPLKPKEQSVGGVGWGVEYGNYLNRGTLLSGKQIKQPAFIIHGLGLHRHLPPRDVDRQPMRAPGRFSWTNCLFDRYTQGNENPLLGRVRCQCAAL
uniref:Uncharacterized protein n=1 Tax=Denticeps clupeoides TaxID=299321 RepID=A0AAY4DMM9_9TELE